MVSHLKFNNLTPAVVEEKVFILKVLEEGQGRAFRIRKRFYKHPKEFVRLQFYRQNFTLHCGATDQRVEQ